MSLNWELIDEAVNDVVSNFKSITGVEGWEVIDIHGCLKQDVVNKTHPAVREFIEKNYKELAGDRTLYDEFLYRLDDVIMDTFCDEAFLRSNK